MTVTDDDVMSRKVPRAVLLQALIAVIKHRDGKITDAEYRDFTNTSELNYIAAMQLEVLLKIANDLNDEQVDLLRGLLPGARQTDARYSLETEP